MRGERVTLDQRSVSDDAVPRRLCSRRRTEVMYPKPLLPVGRLSETSAARHAVTLNEFKDPAGNADGHAAESDAVAHAGDGEREARFDRDLVPGQSHRRYPPHPPPSRSLPGGRSPWRSIATSTCCRTLHCASLVARSHPIRTRADGRMWCNARPTWSRASTSLLHGYPGRYLWHCHVQEHEANDMMRPYDIVDVAAKLAISTRGCANGAIMLE